MNSWGELLAEAARFYNVLHVTSGERLGISARAVAARADREGWARPRRGIVVVPGCPDNHQQRTAVALAGMGGAALVTGRSLLHLAAVIERPPPFVEVLVPFKRSPRSGHGVLVTRSRTFHTEERRGFARFPCTSIERALAEASRRMEYSRVLSAAIEAQRLGLLQHPTAAEVRATMANAKGIRRFEAILERIGGVKVDSTIELESRDLFRAYGYEPWPEPFAFTCPDGVTIELDIAFPYDWVSYECDGIAFHSSGKAFASDRRRWSQQTQAQWSVGWIDRHRLDTDPLGIIADLRSRFARVDHIRPPPPLPRLSRPGLRMPAPRTRAPLMRHEGSK